jgi:hypothetical protein
MNSVQVQHLSVTSSLVPQQVSCVVNKYEGKPSMQICINVVRNVKTALEVRIYF